MTAILGNADLVLMDLQPETDLHALVQQIEQAALTAAALTKQMLAYSGRGKFVIQTLRLDQLIQGMTGLLDMVISKRALLHLDLAPASVAGDAVELRQLIMNLITNASDALGDQTGTIRVRTGTRYADRSYLHTPHFPEETPPGFYSSTGAADAQRHPPTIDLA